MIQERQRKGIIWEFIKRLERSIQSASYEVRHLNKNFKEDYHLS
jgi:hypothetical protein